MVDCTPNRTGSYNPLYALNNQYVLQSSTDLHFFGPLTFHSMVQIFQHMADVGSMCLPLISVLTLARKIIFLIVSVV